MHRPAREAFFLEAQGGGRFCLATHPVGPPKGAVLFVGPFAEELNKSRRMVALAARAFASAGWMVLQLDCYGCGDSAGEFGEADWATWVGDVGLGRRWLSDWLQMQGRDLPLVLWGLRAGSLLIADHLATEPGAQLLLWQPVTSGKQHLTQFLRLKAASEMLAESDAKTAMARVKAALQAGETVEVAGYAVRAALASGMEAAMLRLPSGGTPSVEIVEVGAEGGSVSPAVAVLGERWREEGIRVGMQAHSGPAFWNTQEIETVPGVIEASLAALERLRS